MPISIFVSLTLLLGITMSSSSCYNGAAARHYSDDLSNSELTWEFVSEYEMPKSEGALSYKFEFTKELRLWSRGSSNSKTGQLMYSDDFGKSWKFVDLPDDGLGGDSSIRFIDHKTGWAMDSSTLLKTEDGGESWAKIQLHGVSKFLSLNSMEFANEERGCIAGSTTHRAEPGLGTDAFGIEILCTNDGGKLWWMGYKNEQNNTVSKIVSQGNSIIALVDESVLFITNDGGKNWSRKQFEYPATDIVATSNGTLWTAGEDGLLRYSTDLGDTWRLSSLVMTPGTRIRWSSISFDSSGLGVAVGSSGAVAVTLDEGKTWHPYAERKLSGNLWTVRVQRPFVAISDERKLCIFRLKLGDGDV